MDPDLLAELDELDEGSESMEVEKEDPTLPAIQNSAILHNDKFLQHMDQIQKLVNKKIDAGNLSLHESEYILVARSNEYSAIITRQLSSIAKFIKGLYTNKLYELQSIVTNDLDYIKCVQLIETEKNPEFKHLSRQQAISIAIVVAIPHQNISQKDTKLVISAANDALLLEQHRNLLMIYVESCMHIVAPNLCRLVGSTVSSKLINAAGGLQQLYKIPACNIQVLGSEKKSNAMVGVSMKNHLGFFGQMKMVEETPSHYQVRLVRMLATNVAKCARIDALKSCPSGQLGDRIREQMLERFEKIQEPGMNRLEKALPIPGEQPKKRRGGKRHRKRKEAMGMTEINKYQNRLKFGEAEEEIAEGVGAGMLGSTGKVRVQIKKDRKLKPSKKILDDLKKRQQSGLESSLAFASVTGIQLINPEAAKQSGTQTYFNRESGFKTVLAQKLKKM